MQKPDNKKQWLLAIIVAGIVLFVASIVTASELEERDEFCTSCHRAPEVTYFDRAHKATISSIATDLASFHYTNDNQFRCIDCHRGDQSLEQRAEILWLAAKDTAVHFLATPDQTIEKGNVPAPNPHLGNWQGPERYSRTPGILNDGCLSCHQDALTLVGFENHFHNKLPQAQLAYAQTERLNFPDGWPGEAGSAALLVPEETVLTCLDCHRAHVPGLEFDYFLDETAVLLPACVQCHLEADAGPVDLN
ncbi:MAG: hypothetical protein CL608_30595 [Anaerolineaceae bacterium]|nr:hypothetical protein [Anaerolineaceae bacterium]